MGNCIESIRSSRQKQQCNNSNDNATTMQQQCNNNGEWKLPSLNKLKPLTRCQIFIETARKRSPTSSNISTWKLPNYSADNWISTDKKNVSVTSSRNEFVSGWNLGPLGSIQLDSFEKIQFNSIKLFSWQLNSTVFEFGYIVTCDRNEF